MIQIEVELKGTSPLMMDNPKTMFEPKPRPRPTGQYNLTEDAERRTYRKDNKELYVPSEWIIACMRSASKYVKMKRGTPPLRQIISGIVTISPREIGLGTKDYEVDVKRVVIKGAAIPCARPRIDDWSISFTISYNPLLVPLPPQILREILELGGNIVGIGAYRPEHGGSYGRFEVTKWAVKE